MEVMLQRIQLPGLGNEKCNDDLDCTHLDDRGWKAKYWRQSSDVDIDESKNSSGEVCTLIKNI